MTNACSRAKFGIELLIEAAEEGRLENAVLTVKQGEQLQQNWDSYRKDFPLTGAGVPPKPVIDGEIRFCERQE